MSGKEKYNILLQFSLNFFAAGVQADEKGGKLKARWVISLKKN